MVDATYKPLAGLWKTTQTQQVYYGPDTVEKYLVDALPSKSSKAFIVTGSSLAKTHLISKVEKLLGPERHAGTFSNIKQHAPVADLDKATNQVMEDSSIDTVISIGGGSPIDSAKAISYRLNEKSGKFLFHITVPTTLSAAECTLIAGFTSEEGTKVSVVSPKLVPHIILYDATFALETPSRLWMSTGLRAMDHAVETMYHPTASELPARQMAMSAASSLFVYLPKYKQDPKNLDIITNLQLASFGSLGFIGLNIKGGLGLSHSLGYALGSPYSIPHGITSCMTLGHVVKLKASDPKSSEQLARMLPFVGHSRSGDDKADAERLGDEILKLVDNLGLKTKLGDHQVDKEQDTVIAQRATGSDSGDLYDSVLRLVKGLW